MSSLPKEMPALNAWLKPKRHDRIGEQHRVLLTGVTIDLIDNVADFLLRQKAVDDVERNLVVLRQTFADQHAARRGFDAHHGSCPFRRPAERGW